MKRERVEVSVYGAEIKCASCVNAPGSKETYEWLQAAISRKYGEYAVSYKYYDLHTENQEGADEEVLNQLLNGDLFYPLVMVEGEIVGEGNPRLRKVFQALERYGLQQGSQT